MTGKDIVAEEPPKPRWLNRDVFGFGLTSLLSDASHEMATAVLPAFLASMGAPAAALGLIEGVSDGLSSFTKLWAGWFSDKSGVRKPLVAVGYALTTASQAAFAIVGTWPQLLLGRSVGWIGRGMRGPVRDAMMADVIAPENYGKAFGFERAMDTAGAVVGPFIAFLFLARAGFRGLFWISVIPGSLAILSILFLVRSRKTVPGSSKPFLGRMNELPRRFKFYLGAIFLFGLGDFAHTLLILRVTEVLRPTMGSVGAASVAVLGYTFHNVLNAGSSYGFGYLGDRTNKVRLLAFGYFLAAATFSGFLLNGNHVGGILPLFIFSGVYVGIEEVLEKAVAAEFLPADIRGLGFGALATANGLGDLFSSSLAGFLWTVVSPAAAFSFSLIFSLCGGFLMIFLVY